MQLIVKDDKLLKYRDDVERDHDLAGKDKDLLDRYFFAFMKVLTVSVRIEVLNERLTAIANCYYPSFLESKHCMLFTVMLWPVARAQNPRRHSLPRLRMNQNTCKALIFSMQNSPIGPELKKDKSSEGTSLQQEKLILVSF